MLNIEKEYRRTDDLDSSDLQTPVIIDLDDDNDDIDDDNDDVVGEGDGYAEGSLDDSPPESDEEDEIEF